MTNEARTRDIYPEGAFKEMAGKSYRPSNGTEGDFFMSAWCNQCERFNPHPLAECCPILAATYCFQQGDAGYPSEWIWDGKGQPECTAFIERTQRCEHTPDFFEGGEHG